MDDTQTDDTSPWDAWRSRLAASRDRREDLVATWQENVIARRGSRSETSTRWGNATAGSLDSTSAAVSVNKDWPLTKGKIAQLFSQTPEVRLTPKQDAFRAAVPVFGRVLNDTIHQESVGTAIEEVLADVVNASGIGAIIVGCEKRTEMREVPEVDIATLPPDIQMQVMAGEIRIPMTQVEHVVDVRYPCDRISPADLLVPADFTRSNYSQSLWLGHDGRKTWTQAQSAFGLDDSVKDEALSGDKRSGGTSNSLNTDTTKFRDTDVVNFTEVFYWRHYYHPEETSFKAIQRVVFVDGIDEPVINEEYTGQRRIEGGGMVGVLTLPIRVLTLTYISDDGLPPSDSTVGRFQVDELEASRDAMVQQRKHSIPLRWFDTNRVGPGTRSLLEKGTFQGFIGTNGPGDRAVGEVARASFPQEKFEFDRVVNSDLTEIWQVGTNQAGGFASGERSASEARIIQQNFSTRVGQERDKVTRFFVGITECLAGLLSLYGNFELPEEIGASIGDEGQQRIQTWDRTQIAGEFTYAVRVDSTVLLDANQRIEQLTRALNLTAQSGYVNPKEVIAEIWELSGVDPAKVVIDPQPKGPEPIKVSVSKAEDLNNVMFLAMLMRTGQGPTPEDLSAATKLWQSAMTGMPPQGSEPQGGPPTEIETPEISNAGWEAAPRIDRRQADGGA